MMALLFNNIAPGTEDFGSMLGGLSEAAELMILSVALITLAVLLRRVLSKFETASSNDAGIEQKVN